MIECLQPDPTVPPEEGEGGGDVPCHDLPIEERILEDLWPEVGRGLNEDGLHPVKPEEHGT